MTEIAFYHLQRSSLEQTLPRLLEKTLETGKRAVVKAGSGERVRHLGAHLWTYDPGSFLPHAGVADGLEPSLAARQPVWLTDADDNPNGAAFLFLVDGATSPAAAAYERCFDLFDGNDPDAVSAARDRWKTLKEAGHTLTYWQQGDRGGWEKKA